MLYNLFNNISHNYFRESGWVSKEINVSNNNQNKIRLGKGKKTNQCHLKICCYIDGEEKVPRRLEEREL